MKLASSSFSRKTVSFLILSLILSLFGCPMDEGGQQGDPDAGSEISEDVESEADSALGEDVDDGTDPLLCPLDFGLPAQGCDLVFQDDCPAGAFCQLALAGGSTTPAPLCLGLNHAGPRALHEECSTFDEESRCQPGMLCAGWGARDPRGMACSQFCLLDTGDGCDPESYCTHHFEDIPGYGLCIPRCNPYAEDTCPDGFACVPDPTYANQRSCWPEFRCLLNNEPSGTPTYKKPCDVNALHQSAGCPEGLTCYPSGVAQLCVQPCASDEDCTGLAEGLSCSEPRGEHGLRYCD